MRDHHEAAQPEQICTAVGVGVEALPQAARGGPDQKPAELAARSRDDLLPQGVEQRLDRALEQLQADVAGEAVRDDNVGRAFE